MNHDFHKINKMNSIILFYLANPANLKKILVQTKEVKHLKIKIMSREVRVLPVLEGKAAEDFYKKVAKMKVSQSKEEVREHFRESLEMFSKMKRPNPFESW